MSRPKVLKASISICDRTCSRRVSALASVAVPEDNSGTFVFRFLMSVRSAPVQARRPALQFTACCLISICLAAPLNAHEGHGAPHVQHGLLHYVVNPSHSVPAVVTAAVAILLATRLLRKRSV